MKNIFFIFLYLPTICICAQTLDSIDLDSIGNQLIQLELKNAESNSIANNNRYVTKSSTEWITDFNGDGFPDALFRFEDIGIESGENNYEYRMVLLDGKQHIIDQHIIFGGSLFSYGNLEIDQVRNGIVYALCREKPSPDAEYSDQEEPKSIELAFSLHDGKVKEKNYKRCPLATMKKQIFKKDSPLQIEASLQMDNQYNEEYYERVTYQGDTCNAYLSGCEDVVLSFGWAIPFNPTHHANPTIIKQLLLRKLFFLKEHSLFKTLVQHNLEQLEALNATLIQPNHYGNTTIQIRQLDGWQSSLYFAGNEAQGSYLTILFRKPVNLEVMDFWDSMESKVRLN